MGRAKAASADALVFAIVSVLQMLQRRKQFSTIDDIFNIYTIKVMGNKMRNGVTLICSFEDVFAIEISS